jgi:hypothetical protein
MQLYLYLQIKEFVMSRENKNTIEDFLSWYKSHLGRYAPLGKSTVTRVTGDSENGTTELSMTFYTHNNQYNIKAKIPSDDSSNGYLGCIASARTPRAGEDWTRGNDLPDGPLNKKTWAQIIRAIVSYEIVNVAQQEQDAAGMACLTSDGNILTQACSDESAGQ